MVQAGAQSWQHVLDGRAGMHFRRGGGGGHTCDTQPHPGDDGKAHRCCPLPAAQPVAGQRGDLR